MPAVFSYVDKSILRVNEILGFYVLVFAGFSCVWNLDSEAGWLVMFENINPVINVF